jgi:hypothetical protein
MSPSVAEQSEHAIRNVSKITDAPQLAGRFSARVWHGTGSGRPALRGRLCSRWTVPMAKQDDYRKYATDEVRLAFYASSTAKKILLLALAERWLDLPDAQDRRAKAAEGFRVMEANGQRRETRTASGRKPDPAACNQPGRSPLKHLAWPTLRDVGQNLSLAVSWQLVRPGKPARPPLQV